MALQRIQDSCCKKVYSPNKDIQRFCINCEVWFHEGCLIGPIEFTPEDQDPEDLEKLTQFVPICRGLNGCGRDQQKDWHVAGTGRKIEKARGWVDKEAAPEDWRQRLGSVFVDEMVKTNWSYYQCPSCTTQL
jgi:hypothetical protein